MLAFNQVILKKEVMGPLASGVLSSIDTWELLGGARSLALQVRASKASGSDTLLIQFETSNDGVNWLTSALPSLAVAAGVTSQAMRTVTSVNGRMARLCFGWSGGSGEGTLWVSATGRISRGAASRAQKAPARPLMAPLTKGALAALPGTSANMIRGAPKAGLDAKECGAGCACAPCGGALPTAAKKEKSLHPLGLGVLTPIGLPADCTLEWTPLEYAALEDARLNTMDELRSWLRGVDCTPDELSDVTIWNWPRATPIPGLDMAESLDGHLWGRLKRRLGYVASGVPDHPATEIWTEPMRWGARSALATIDRLAADTTGGEEAVRDTLFADTVGPIEIGCHVRGAPLGTLPMMGDIDVAGRSRFRECVSPPEPAVWAPDIISTIDIVERYRWWRPEFARAVLLPYLPTLPLPPAPVDTGSAIVDAKRRAIRELNRAHERLLNMTAVERLAAVQCRFPGATQSDADAMGARYAAAAVALGTHAVQFMDRDAAGRWILPGYSVWARAISTNAAGETINRPDPSDTLMDESLWFVVVTRNWLELSEERRVAVLAHEAMHLSDPLVVHPVGRPVPRLLDANWLEVFFTDLTEVNRGRPVPPGEPASCAG